MTDSIGIAGTGRMGTAFARRLIETGHEVKVWNRSAARLAKAVEAGAIATDIAGLAGCDVILLSLVDAAASNAVMDQLVTAGVSGRLVIDLSTLLPDQADALAVKAASGGAAFLHCPVGGTVAPALKGQLLGLAGGTRAAFDRAQPVLADLCRRVEHLGTPGAAARMKLAVNLPLAVYWQTLGESLALLRGAGVPNDMALSLIADSSAGPAVLKNRMQVVLDTVNGTDQAGTFDIAGLMKDLGLALQLGRAEGAAMPLATATEGRYRAALEAGLGGFDGATLARLTGNG